MVSLIMGTLSWKTKAALDLPSALPRSRPEGCRRVMGIQADTRRARQARKITQHAVDQVAPAIDRSHGQTNRVRLVGELMPPWPSKVPVRSLTTVQNRGREVR